MRFADQARVFRLIPGLEKADFVRFGQMHRNTYINSPALLRPSLQLKTDPRVFFAGQISGVEGYAESIATGLIAGRNAAAVAGGFGEPLVFPRATALGSLCHYITAADPRHFQPANITFDLLPALDDETKQKFKRDKKGRHVEICRRAATAFEEFTNANDSRMYSEVSG
jgi:methylenetetrahydrofolate--tRNA-(uracil-5-)-methyltransferase